MTLDADQHAPAQQRFLTLIGNNHEGNNPKHFLWYASLLESNWSKLDSGLQQIVPCVDRQLDVPVFYGLLSAVAECLTTTDQPSLSQLSDLLVEQGYLINSDESQEMYRHQLVFIIIGWVTMLYTPIYTPEPGVLSISPALSADGTPLFTSTFSTTSLISIDEVARLPIHQVLKHFGELIPGSINYKPLATINPRTTNILSDQLLVSCLNYWTLSKIAAVKIEFVEILSLHLEFDEETQTLKIFRFPSVCRLMCIPGFQGRKNNYLHS